MYDAFRIFLANYIQRNINTQQNSTQGGSILVRATFEKLYFIRDSTSELLNIPDFLWSDSRWARVLIALA